MGLATVGGQALPVGGGTPQSRGAGDLPCQEESWKHELSLDRKPHEGRYGWLSYRSYSRKEKAVEHLETLQAISPESGSAEKVSVVVCPDCRTSRSSEEEKGKQGGGRATCSNLSPEKKHPALQTREFKEERIKSLTKVQRRVYVLRGRQMKGNRRAGSILGLAMVGSQSLPLGLKG